MHEVICDSRSAVRRVWVWVLRARVWVRVLGVRVRVLCIRVRVRVWYLKKGLESESLKIWTWVRLDYTVSSPTSLTQTDRQTQVILYQSNAMNCIGQTISVNWGVTSYTSQELFKMTVNQSVHEAQNMEVDTCTAATLSSAACLIVTGQNVTHCTCASPSPKPLSLHGPVHNHDQL